LFRSLVPMSSVPLLEPGTFLVGGDTAQGEIQSCVQPPARQESNEEICRVCHGGEDDGGLLLSPCLCVGSVEKIHESCLNEWRLRSERLRDALRCELCGFDYLFCFRRASRRESAFVLLGQLLAIAPPVIIFMVFFLQVYPHEEVCYFASTMCGVWSTADAGFSFMGRKRRWEGFSCGLMGACFRRLSACFHGALEGEMRVAEMAFAAVELARAEVAQQELSADIVAQVEAEREIWSRPPAERGRSRIRCQQWEVYLFCAMLAADTIFFCLRRGLGRSRFHALGFAFDCCGLGYLLLVLVMEVACVIFCPPLCIQRDNSGLPVVRSLTLADRELARQSAAVVERGPF